MSALNNTICLGIFLIIVTPFLIKYSSNNTCQSYFDYFLINFSKNCYYNGDADLIASELIKKYTGHVNIYTVTSSDGYISTLFRIPRKNSKGVILLHPPMGATSVFWMMEGNQSLAFRVWNIGYDVWLSNRRGSVYSRTHVNLTDSDSQYYNFSFEEVALFDFDVYIDLIRSKTNNSQIIFLGYSLSGTEAFVYSSVKSEEACKYFKLFILLAPAVNHDHGSALTPIFDFISFYLTFFKTNGELITAEVFKVLDFFTIFPYILDKTSAFLSGNTVSGIDSIFYPFIRHIQGKGVTFKMMNHFTQFSSKTNFSFYDYGEEQNKIIYGSHLAPDYPLQNVCVPTYLIYGQNDTTISLSSIGTLINEQLSKSIIYGNILIHNCNHIDFLLNRNVSKQIYKYILDILAKHIQG